MAFKFPFTNYHELNLNWVLEELKKLFEDSKENVSTIETYDERLTAVETELPTVSATAQDAAQNAAAASTAAQQATATANTAQENATQAQSIAGFARQEAQAAQTAADAATQAAQQATATAQNFDGRITQAQNDASTALEASRSFENRVQAAITTANNAANTATNAQGIAMRADQNAALALDTLNSQRAELERIGAEQAALITAETEDKKTEIENLAESVLDSIPTDYTELSELVDKKAPLIIDMASGVIASFVDGADNMKIQKLVVNIKPLQEGSGEPSPVNNRPISGWTGAEIEQRGKNLCMTQPTIGPTTRLLTYNKPFNPGKVRVTLDVTNLVFGNDNGVILNYGVVGVANNYQYFNDLKKADGSSFTVNGTPYTGKVYIQINNTADFNFMTLYASNSSYNYWSGTINWCMVTIGDEDVSTYEPYTGNQISVTFPDTIYGGEDEVIGGKLIAVNGFKRHVGASSELWKESSWTKTNTSVFYAEVSLPNAKQPTETYNCILLCNWLPVVPYITLRDIDEPGVCITGGNEAYVSIRVPKTIASTVAELQAYLENNPLDVVYELATPVEYDLTPQTMETHYGTNNIWADAGPVSVDYPADTKMYIDGKLAELQATILENI